MVKSELKYQLSGKPLPKGPCARVLCLVLGMRPEPGGPKLLDHKELGKELVTLG